MRPRLRQRPRVELAISLFVFQNRFRFAANEPIEPFVKADSQFVARQERQLLRFEPNTFELAEIAGSMRAAANPGYLKVQVRLRLALSNVEINEVKRTSDDPAHPDLARLDREMFKGQRRCELSVGESQDLCECGLT